MATKKAAADKAEEKKAPVKKTTTKKATKPKTPEKKAAPEQPKVEELEVEKVGKDETGYDPKILKPEEVEDKEPETPAIIDDSDKILKASDVELPADEPAGKQTVVVSHKGSVKGIDPEKPDELTVISAEEVLKDLEYDFDAHEIKPFTGKAMTSHEMHQGKYGIIDDVTKPKKRK